MKLLEKICYNCRAHEYTPLGAWDAMDRLSAHRQPDNVHEVKHYESFKSVTEMCKASGINFAVMCSANVNMAIETLSKEGKLADAPGAAINGTYEKGTYFDLDDDQRKLVDKVVEDMCLSVRFLSLSLDRLHAASKQELQNDMVQGEDKYPRTITATLRFLQYHNLRGKQINDKKIKNPGSETAFTQQGDEDDDDDPEKQPGQ